MRNLKRALSLTLASVMLLGMMVVGSSATKFPDVDKNDNIEAIEVLEAVKVFIGNEKGEFEPDKYVTRAEMAVVMAKLLGLDYRYYETSCPFTDVPSWAVPYVSACAANGIVAGRGEGIYDPNNTVTAVEAAAMMMRALGYFQYEADYQGNFEAATVKQASQIGLFTGINGNAKTPMDRNQVAQLALNTLQSNMVYFTGDPGFELNGVKNIGFRSEYTYRTGTETKYAALSSLGNATDIVGSTVQGQYYIQLGEELYDGKLTKRADVDVFDRPSTTWRYNYNIVGTYLNTPDLEYHGGVSAGKIYTDLGLIESVSTSDNGGGHYVDGKQAADVTIAKNGGSVSGSGAGVLTQVWYTDYINAANVRTREVTITHINTYVGKVNTVGSSSITLTQYGRNDGKVPAGTLNNTYSTKDFDLNEMVTYTAAHNSTSGRYDIQSVEHMDEYDSGILTKWTGNKLGENDLVTDEKGNSNFNFTVDSTTYNYSKNYIVLSEGAEREVWDFNVNQDEVNVYKDKYGYAIYVEGIEGDKNYAAVIGVGGYNPYGDQTMGVTLLMADGSQRTVTAKLKAGSPALSTKDDNSNQMVADIIGDVVTYKILDDGTYELNVLGNFDKTPAKIGANASFTNGKAEIKFGTGAGDTWYANERTIFFVCTNDKQTNPVGGDNGWSKSYSVYVGYQNMPSFSDTDLVTGFALMPRNEYTHQLDAVYISAPSMAGLSSADTVFVKGYGATVTTDNTGAYFTLNAVVNGEVTKVKVDTSYFYAAYAAYTNQAVNSINNSNSRGVFAINNVVKDKNGIITSFKIDNERVFRAANGTKPTAYGYGIGTVAADRGVLGIGVDKPSAVYWDYNNRTSVYYVSSGYSSISLSSVGSVITDNNDEVYASYNDSTKTLVDTFIVERAATVAPGTYVVSVADPKTNIKQYTISNGTTTKTNESMTVVDKTTVTVTFTAEAGYVFTENGKATIEKTYTVNGANLVVPVPASQRGQEQITLSFDLGEGIRYVEIGGVKYSTGSTLTGEKGKVLTATVKQKDGVTGTPAVVFQPDNDPTGGVNIPVQNSTEYDVTLTTNGTLVVRTAADKAKLDFEDAKARIESRTFDLYYKVEDDPSLMRGAGIQYFDNPEGFVHGKAWSRIDTFTATNGNGVDYKYNKQVEVEALEDFLSTLTRDEGDGYELNQAVTGSPIGITNDPQYWSTQVGPTRDGSGLVFTRKVAVFGKTGLGALDPTNEIGQITVKYKLTEIAGTPEDWKALDAPDATNVASATGSASGNKITITGTDKWDAGVYRLYLVKADGTTESVSGTNDVTSAAGPAVAVLSVDGTTLTFSGITGRTNGDVVKYKIAYYGEATGNRDASALSGEIEVTFGA